MPDKSLFLLAPGDGDLCLFDDLLSRTALLPTAMDIMCKTDYPIKLTFLFPQLTAEIEYYGRTYAYSDHFIFLNTGISKIWLVIYHAYMH